MINISKVIKREIPRAVFIIALGSFIFGCMQDSIKKEYYDNGSLKSELSYVDGQLLGVQKYYYPNGNIKEIHDISQESTHYEGYYDDGTLLSKGNIKNKKRFGKWIYYHNDGKVKAVGMYNKNGLKNGKWEYYANEDSTKVIFWDIFVDTAHNFMINYPKGWTIRTDIKNTILVALPEDVNEVELKNVNFNILQINLENNMSLEQVSSVNIKETAQAYKDFNFTLLKEGEDKINELETKWYAYSIDKENNTHIILQFFIMADSKVFQISFFVLKDYYYEYLTLYKEIAYSFNLMS